MTATAEQENATKPNITNRMALRISVHSSAIASRVTGSA
jgi:hypothetical protein